MPNPAANVVSIERNRPSMIIANVTGTRTASVAPRLVAPTMASVTIQTTTQRNETFR